MTALAIPALLLLLAVVLAVVVAIQRSTRHAAAGGADIVAYLVMAVAMGVTGFALAQLASTAFPGDRFVFDASTEVASSLAALVVSTPFLIYFWRRQSARRAVNPAAAGWTLYLALMELVFMTAFVTAAVGFVDGLLDGDSASAWTSTVVFGLIVVFHELAARRTPPLSDAGELQRVIGSAIGLITATIGLAGTMAGLFELVISSDRQVGFHPWVAMLIVGAPVWGYRWLRRWAADEPSVPRLAWTTVVSIAGLTVAIGSATSLLVMILQYLLGDTPPAGQHFETAPVALGLLIAGIPVTLIHRRALGTERSDPIRAFELGMAAIGLIGAAIAAVALTALAFDRSGIVGGGPNDTITFAVTLVVGLTVWQLFTRRSEREDLDLARSSWPRRLYHLGVGVIFGLVSAGALITTLVILIRQLLNGGSGAGLVTPASIFFYTGLAAWYLLAAYARDRTVLDSGEVVAPFDVTIITSHPGMISTMFPKEARLRIIHRGDEAGAIDDEKAAAIVGAVANRSSIVWVDEDGFRVAPARPAG
jgi:Domain of unknown function (DUF5671)